MPPVVQDLTCVVATGYTGNFFLADQLPQGTRFLAMLLRPQAGKTTLRSNKTVQLLSGEIAGGYAMPTTLELLPTGLTFDEALFSTYSDSIAEYPLRNILEFAERWPHPPGMNFSLRGTRIDRKMTPFLNDLSERIAARGGLFSVVFHTRLGSWNIRGNADALMNSLLLNASDPRLEAVLTWRLPTVVDLDGKSQFSTLEEQDRILTGAEGTVSDQAAALFAVRLEHPMRDFRERFLDLLRRDMPKLRAQICNTLAIDYKKPERMLPFAKDKEGWEQRVAEMSQTWLNELGG
jgi:hypothetical protein